MKRHRAETVLSLPRTGRMVRLRDLSPVDLPPLRRAFVRADPAVLRARFGGAAPKFASIEKRVRCLDGHARFAVAAFSADDEVVGVGEYVMSDGGGGADFAVVVARAWQHEGIATAMLRRLSAHAMREGITTGTALLSGSNSQVLELVRDIPMPHSIAYDHGAGELCVDLTEDFDTAVMSPAQKE